MSRMTPAKDGKMPMYLGDGAYVQQDRNNTEQIWLTAENGIEATDAVALGPNEIRGLILYAKSLGWKL